MLRPRLEFSNDLEAAGVRYYRLSWRKGSSGSFLPLTGQVHHYYRHDVVSPTGKCRHGPLNYSVSCRSMTG